jgi:hypothetical protein
MQLYTKTSPTNVGMLSTKVAFLFDYRVILTPEETALVRKYQHGDFTVGTWEGDKGMEFYVSLNQAVQGKKGHCFTGLGPLTRFEASLIEGCQKLCVNLDELRRISAGGERVLEITAEGPRPVSLQPTISTTQPSAPPPIPTAAATQQPQARA